MIWASRYNYKMYSLGIIFTSPNEYLLDRGLGIVAKDIDWHLVCIIWYALAYHMTILQPININCTITKVYNESGKIMFKYR